MIKFFRKIRYNLMSKNKTGKYLKYAIGEIILVMIGILLALQVNNWNENNKSLRQANSHLETIKLNLKDDIKQADSLIAISNLNIEFANTFLDQFKTLKPVDENIQMYMVSLMLEHNIEINKSGIDALTSSTDKFNINEVLLVKILNYYRHVEQLKSREVIASSDIKQMYEPYVKEKYYWIYNKSNPWPRQTEFYKNDPRPLPKINQRDLLADKRLEIMIFGRRWQHMNLRDLYNKTIVLAKEIISEIDTNNSRK